MKIKKPMQFNDFLKFFIGLVFTFSISTTIINCTKAYSQEKESPVATTEMQTGNQVVEQVNSIEGGEMLGGIDWENRVIYAVGDGVMPPDAVSPAQARVRAKRAAIDDAYGRMIETAHKVRVDAESTTRDFINENRVVHTKVTEMVRHAEVEEIKQFDDGSFQVKMKMPMDGAEGLSASLLPTQINKVRKVRVISHTKKGTISPASASSSTEAVQEATVQKALNYTGLIINAKGLGAKPAMYPRILDESGNSVYDVASANPNATIEEGLTGYRKSIDAAKQVARVGNNPLIIKATKISGKYNADIIVADSDAHKIFQADSKGGILGEAKVVVVID
jgi:hypothetical protein